MSVWLSASNYRNMLELERCCWVVQTDFIVVVNRYISVRLCDQYSSLHVQCAPLQLSSCPFSHPAAGCRLHCNEVNNILDSLIRPFDISRACKWHRNLQIPTIFAMLKVSLNLYFKHFFSIKIYLQFSMCSMFNV